MGDPERQSDLIYPEDALADRLRSQCGNVIEAVNHMKHPLIFTHVDTDVMMNLRVLEDARGTRFQEVFFIDSSDRSPTVGQLEVIARGDVDDPDGVIFLDMSPKSPEKIAWLQENLQCPIVVIDHHEHAEFSTPVLRANSKEMLGDSASAYCTTKIVADLFGIRPEDLWILQLGLYGDEREHAWAGSPIMEGTVCSKMKLAARMLNILGLTYEEGESEDSTDAEARRVRLFNTVRDTQSLEELIGAIEGSLEFGSMFAAISNDIEVNLDRLREDIEFYGVDFLDFTIETPSGRQIAMVKEVGQILEAHPELFILFRQLNGEQGVLSGCCHDPRVNCGKIFSIFPNGGGGREDAGGGKCNIADVNSWAYHVERSVYAQRRESCT